MELNQQLTHFLQWVEDDVLNGLYRQLYNEKELSILRTMTTELKSFQGQVHTFFKDENYDQHQNDLTILNEVLVI